MPDSSDSQAEAKASPVAPGAAPGAAAGVGPARGRRLAVRLALIGGVLAIIAFFGGREVFQRLNYVYAEDARIDADLITVSSRVAGWVTGLNVTEGDGIAKGDVLLTIDARESRLKLSEMEAQLSGLEAERTRMAAERQLVDRQTKGLHASELSKLEAARVAVSSMKPELTLARREHERAKSLYEKKVFSRRQLDQAENVVQRLDREHLNAVAAMKAAEAKVHEAEAERSRLDVLDGEIAMLRYRRAELLAKTEHQRLDLADRTIKAPVSGVVDKTFVLAGEYVTPGQRLALVHDPKRIWIEANIKETDIRRLKTGQDVEVGIDAYPDMAFRGRVLSIGNAATSEFALLPSPNPSGNFTKITQRLPVRIAIDQQRGLLRPGMMVIVNIDVRNTDR